MALLNRQRRHSGTAALSARRVDLTRLARTRGKQGGVTGKVSEQAWQEESWAYFDEIPEVKHGVWFLGNAMSKLRLFPTVYDPDTDTDVPVMFEDAPVAPDLAMAAIEELNRLRSEDHGLPEIVRELEMNLEVAGECWLIGIGAREELVNQRGDVEREATPEQWDIKSISEVKVEGGRFRVKVGANDTQGKQVLHPDHDTAIRIWLRHPRYSEQADCNMRGVLVDCKVLSTLALRILAESNSRMSNGAVTMPTEVQFQPANPTIGIEGGDGPAQDPFLTQLEDAMLSPIEDPSSSSAVVPMVIRGPAEYLTDEYIRHIDLGHSTKATELKDLIEGHVMRLARGLNLPVEVTQGHMSTTFANANQIDQDLYDDRLAPRVATLQDALELAYLRPNLIARGFNPDEVNTIGVGADPSDMLSKADPVEHAFGLWDRYAITTEALVTTLGFTANDIPAAGEVLERVATRKGIFTADLTVWLLQELAEEAGVELPEPGNPAEPVVGNDEKQGPTGGGGARGEQLVELLRAAIEAPVMEVHGEELETELVSVDATVTRFTTTAGERTGRRLAQIDADLRTRLHVAADDAMVRALERAGNRLRSKGGPTLRRQLAGVEPSRIAAALGRDHQVFESNDPDELLAEAFDALEQDFMAWAGQAQSDALDAAAELASGISGATRQSLKLRQAEDAAEAWQWFSGALRNRGADLLFDPNGAVEAIGEVSAHSRVPAGMVRGAMARAGGAPPLGFTDEGGAFITIGDGDAGVGGIGTGDTVMGALRDEGVGVEGYRWVYGPAMRTQPFPPHVALDGVKFEHFDDPQLANTSGWPDGAYYLPGDHPGCICDIEPILMEP